VALLGSPGEQVQVLEEAADDRVVAVLLLELQRQALGKRAREYARRVERLQAGKNFFDLRLRCTELLSDRTEVGPWQVAGLVDHVDEILTDQPLDRLLEHQRHLCGQVLAQRDVVGEEGFDVDVVAGAGGALAQRSPAGGVLPVGAI